MAPPSPPRSRGAGYPRRTRQLRPPGSSRQSRQRHSRSIAIRLRPGSRSNLDPGDCGQGSAPESESSSAPANDPSDRETHGVAGANPRVAVTYDGDVLGLDGIDPPAERFTRLNQAGDNRHLFLTASDSFRLLDTATWSEPHGDHSHSYTTDPLLSDQRIEGNHPGHLVVHYGIAAAFFDGDGVVETFDPSGLDATTAIETHDQTLPDPHHVAVPREDGRVHRPAR